LEINFDEILSEAGIEEQTQEPEQQKISYEEYKALKEENASLKSTKDKMADDFRSLRSKYDVSINHIGKLTGYVEGAGVAKFDRETGELISLKQDNSHNEILSLEKEITKESKSLEKQFKNGDIDHEEYLESRNELTEKQNRLTELKVEQKFKQNQKPTDMQATKPTPEKVEQQSPTESNSEAYDRIITQHPDVTNQDSQLFKEMQRIFNENPDRYARGNYQDGKGDANIYAELVNKANQAIESSDKYETPRSRGYQDKGGNKSYLDKNQTQMLVNSGVNDSNVLRDINRSIGNWEKSGEIKMEF